MIVIKRDGTKENFDIDKIQRAVYSAFKATGKPMPDYLVKMIDSLFSQLKGDAIGVEEIPAPSSVRNSSAITIGGILL